MLNIIKEMTGHVPYPADPSKTISDFWSAPQLTVLGSGSDFTVFIDYLGIPSVDFYYSINSGPNQVYHSIYDTFYWMDTYGDPGFQFSLGLERLIGLLIIRFADDVVIPLNYTNYALQLQSYLQSIEQQAAPIGQFDFSQLANAIDAFTKASIAIDSEANCVRTTNSPSCTNNLNDLNNRIQLGERQLLINANTNSSDGLPRRPWYKHVVQAPGFYDGYGGQVFPGIAQGIIENDTTLIQQQIIRAADTILAAAYALTVNSTTVIIVPGNSGCVLSPLLFIMVAMLLISIL